MFTDGFMFIMNRIITGLTGTLSAYNMGKFCAAALFAIITVALVVGVVAFVLSKCDGDDNSGCMGG